MPEELMHIPQDAQALVMRRPPEQVLADGKRAAAAIMQVINAKPAEDKVIMNGAVFLELEDWSTIARFFQTAPRIVEDHFCQYGDASGFEATAELIDINTGSVISRATAMCLNDEDNWGARTVYEWQDVLDENGKKIWIEGKNGKKGRYKANKVEVGTKPTPLFQLKSMAQTRAAAKVQRLVYSWVLVLAGVKISPTPAEEIGFGEPGMEETEPRQEIAPPQKKETPSGSVISEARGKRLFAIGKQAGRSNDEIKAVCASFGFSEIAEVTNAKYEEVIAAVEKKTESNGKAPIQQASAAARPFEVSGKTETVLLNKDSRGDFLQLDMSGLKLFTREPEHIKILKDAQGLECVFMATQVGDKSKMQAKIVSILKCGAQEWLSDGTPVIRTDADLRGEALFGA